MYAFKCGKDSENKLKGICKFQSKGINSNKIKTLWMEVNIERKVISMLFVQLIMKCIISHYLNLQYQHLMKNDVMKMTLNILLGVNNISII